MYYSYFFTQSFTDSGIIKRKYGETDWAGQTVCIMDLEHNLGIVHTYYAEKGTFKKVRKDLSTAKNTLKSFQGQKRNNISNIIMQ